MGSKGNFALKDLPIRGCYLYVKNSLVWIWASIVVVSAVAVAICFEIPLGFIADTLNVDVQLRWSAFARISVINPRVETGQRANLRKQREDLEKFSPASREVVFLYCIPSIEQAESYFEIAQAAGAVFSPRLVSHFLPRFLLLSGYDGQTEFVHHQNAARQPGDERGRWALDPKRAER
jgi:hypothetical protein